MAEFGDQELGLLRALGERDAPTREDEDRVARRLEAELGIALGAGVLVLGTTSVTSSGGGAALAAASGAGAPAAPAALTTAGAASLGAKWAFVGATSAKWLVAGVVATSAVGYVALDASEKARAPEASVVVPAAPAVSVVTPGERETMPSVLAAPPPTPADLAVVPASPEPRQRSEASKPRRLLPAKGLDAELPLIAEAQRALSSGNPAEALRVLERHRVTFPSGALVVERSGLVAIALCQSGQTTEGARRASAFLARHESTPLAARVRKACAP